MNNSTPLPPQKHTQSSIVLFTVSGTDAPGITSELAGILSEQNVAILDIGQSVLHGWLSLSFLFSLGQKTEDKAVLKDLLFKATEMGLKPEMKVMHERALQPLNHSRRLRYAVTLIADQISATSFHKVTSMLVEHQMNIDTIDRLSEGQFSCVELIVSKAVEYSSPHQPLGPIAHGSNDLKKDLLNIARNHGVDIALQAEGLYRRSKRLVVLDMDSTLIQNEVIDEFAKENGSFDQVSKITEEAMQGKMDFNQSLAKRVEALKGLTTDQIDTVWKRIQLTPGAADLIRVLKKLGYKTGVISGGFSIIADRIRDQLGLDYAYANQLELINGVATGKVIAPIINAQRKADLLEVIAQQERIQLDQVIAVGDGANDLLMLEKAGLGIAFNAKPIVREKADFSVNQRNLSSILYLLGISGRDLAEILN